MFLFSFSSSSGLWQQQQQQQAVSVANRQTSQTVQLPCYDIIESHLLFVQFPRPGYLKVTGVRYLVCAWLKKVNGIQKRIPFSENRTELYSNSTVRLDKDLSCTRICITAICAYTLLMAVASQILYMHIVYLAGTHYTLLLLLQ